MIGLPRAGDVRALLLDADGNLFPSEEPAFVASADVTNRFLRSLGIRRSYTAEELRLTTTGKNFRTTAADLAAAHGVTLGGPDLSAELLEDWVTEERKIVTDYLGRVLRPDPAVLGPLRRLGTRYRLAAVSSSALARLDECFRATGLDQLVPAQLRFSAEDSLDRPTSKPDPAVYRFALDRLRLAPRDTIAIEDAVPGAQSAVAAGIPTVGNLVFVAPGERELRRSALIEAGVSLVIESWEELAAALGA